MFYADTIRLVGFTIGAFLHLTLLFVILQNKKSGQREWHMLLVILFLTMWHTGNAVSALYWLLGGASDSLFVKFFQLLALAGLLFLPSLVLHTNLIFYRQKISRDPIWWKPALSLIYLPALLLPAGLYRLIWAPAASAWEALKSFQPFFSAWISVSLFASTALASVVSTKTDDATEKHFFRRLAILFLMIGLGTAYIFHLGKGTALATGIYYSSFITLASIIPTVFIAFYIYRFNYLELIINRRLIYIIFVSILVSLYLFFIRRLSGYLEWKYEVFSDLAELVLIFATITFAIPIYVWINRFITKRIQIYSDFTRSLNEHVSSILTLKPRLEFIAASLSKQFQLRKVAIALVDHRVNAHQVNYTGLVASSNATEEHWDAELQSVAVHCLEKKAEVLRMRDSQHLPFVPRLLSLGFTHVFPLLHETRLVGLMLVDAYPRKYLEEYEGSLIALSDPIANSIESCRMIEDRIRLEKALLMQENMANLGRVATQIAHEIKNPLSSIKTIVQLMQEDNKLDHEYIRDLSFINNEVNRLNSSVMQLLNFAKPLPESKAVVNLSEMLMNALTVLSKQARESQVKIISEISPGLVLPDTNPEGLSEIIFNLMINALQASPNAGAVSVKAKRSPSEITVEVLDEGGGIPASLLDKIFEPFFTTKQKGTGLGLAIVKKNVESMGGHIQVQSPIQNGAGTKFTVTFPLTKL